MGFLDTKLFLRRARTLLALDAVLWTWLRGLRSCETIIRRSLSTSVASNWWDNPAEDFCRVIFDCVPYIRGLFTNSHALAFFCIQVHQPVMAPFSNPIYIVLYHRLIFFRGSRTYFANDLGIISELCTGIFDLFWQVVYENCKEQQSEHWA